jgi:hypothetical protein
MKVDTLALQCEVDKDAVLNGELVHWLKQSGLEDFGIIFAALGVDSVIAINNIFKNKIKIYFGVFGCCT